MTKPIRIKLPSGVTTRVAPVVTQQISDGRMAADGYEAPVVRVPDESPCCGARLRRSVGVIVVRGIADPVPMPVCTKCGEGSCTPRSQT